MSSRGSQGCSHNSLISTPQRFPARPEGCSSSRPHSHRKVPVPLTEPGAGRGGGRGAPGRRAAGRCGRPCPARPRRLCSAGPAARSGRRGLGRRGRAVRGEGAGGVQGAALGAGRGSVCGQPSAGAGGRTGNQALQGALRRRPRCSGASCPPREASPRGRGYPRAGASPGPGRTAWGVPSGSARSLGPQDKAGPRSHHEKSAHGCLSGSGSVRTAGIRHSAVISRQGHGSWGEGVAGGDRHSCSTAPAGPGPSLNPLMGSPRLG